MGYTDTNRWLDPYDVQRVMPAATLAGIFGAIGLAKLGAFRPLFRGLKQAGRGAVAVGKPALKIAGLTAAVGGAGVLGAGALGVAGVGKAAPVLWKAAKKRPVLFGGIAVGGGLTARAVRSRQADLSARRGRYNNLGATGDLVFGMNRGRHGRQF